jgi:hypothetical protein
VLRDIAHLTRRPVRATLMVIAAAAAVRQVSDPESSWRGWLDHALVIVLIGTITWCWPAWSSWPNGGRSRAWPAGTPA